MPDYSIVIERQFRRSIRVEVLQDRTVKVTAPRFIPQSIIDTFLKKRERWIQGRLSRPLPKEWVDDETWQYLGQSYRLKLIEAKGNAVTFEGDVLQVISKSPQKTLLTWFRNRAYDVLEDRVCFFAKQMGVTPNDIRVKSMKTRWGSCSSKGNLNFNWTLIMAPLPVLDYVVIHELAHLKHMDHSKSFWNFVSIHCPDYKVYVKWLKDNSLSYASL